PKELDRAGLVIAEPVPKQPRRLDPDVPLQPEPVPAEALDVAGNRVEWRRRHGLGKLKSDPVATESCFEDHVRYYLHVPQDAPQDALVVCFSSAGPGEPAVYSHVGALGGTGCVTLFVRVTQGLFLGVRRGM